MTKKKDFSIHVTGFTDEDLINFRSQVHDAVESGQGYVQVTINSYGGDAYNCLAMMNILESLDTAVVTTCEGYAMSSGAALLTCGDKDFRFAHPDATIMVHQLNGGNIGSTSEMHTNLEQNIKLQDRLFNKMAKNIGKKPGFFQNLIKKANNMDIYLSAEEAQKIGIVNELKIPNIQTVTTQHVEII